jgi:hypothetical protein
MSIQYDGHLAVRNLNNGQNTSALSKPIATRNAFAMLKLLMD